MAEIAIPKSFGEALEALVELDDTHVATLMAEVADQAPFLQVAELQRAITSTFAAEDRARADQLIPALIGLRGSLRSSVPVEEMAAMVSRSGDLTLSAEQRERLKSRLLPLLGCAAVASTAAAVELLTQHPRNYQSSRVITDIRPVFGGDPTTPPLGVVVVDTLQFSTWNRDGKHETISVAMDAVDLASLREVIDRALAKTTTVRGMMAAQGLTTFEMDKDA
jgi:hypothetical protein